MITTIAKSKVLNIVGLTIVLFLGCSRESSSRETTTERDAELRATARRHSAFALELQTIGEYEKAIEEYSHSIRLDPTNPIPYNNRGLVRATLNELDKAIEDYTEAIQRNVNYSDALLNRGDAWYRKGDVQKAIADYTQMIKINAKDADAYSSRGNAKIHTGDFDDAIADFSASIRQAIPEIITTVVALGWKKMNWAGRSKTFPPQYRSIPFTQMPTSVAVLRGIKNAKMTLRFRIIRQA